MAMLNFFTGSGGPPGEPRCLAEYNKQHAHAEGVGEGSHECKAGFDHNEPEDRLQDHKGESDDT